MEIEVLESKQGERSGPTEEQIAQHKETTAQVERLTEENKGLLEKVKQLETSLAESNTAIATLKAGKTLTFFNALFCGKKSLSTQENKLENLLFTTLFFGEKNFSKLYLLSYCVFCFVFLRKRTSQAEYLST